jgi:hypothetical protein
VQVFAEMSADQAKKENQERETDEDGGGTHEIPAQRLPLQHVETYPTQQQHSDRSKHQGDRLKNPPEIIRLLPAL